METAVELHEVDKIIAGNKIIDNMTLTIRSGEIYGLLGPNGAGKTTTIRMIVGLMRPSKGSITIEGVNLETDFESAVRHVGAVVENPEMYDFLSGWHNLIHYKRMHHGVTEERLKEVVELVGMSSRIHEKVKTYSLGMRQRLGLAQALLHRPRVLILDEPTNGLDPAGIREIRSYLKKLAHEDGISIIVSSHLLAEMEKMCDRIAIIQKGKLIEVADVFSFLQQDKNLLYLEAVPLEKAIKVLGPNRKVQRYDNGLQLVENKENIPALIQELSDSGVAIYEIRPSDQRTLEDKFLSITGGGS
ncbi:ABC transporter ATP-binding protein [Alkalicoccus halolimnae]|uniref:ABC transporter ATP-binding protein n=1 Tax=Alkalicoccus halolimnae TaxID=1667239 RepID=A0A5C7F3A8_9BACI|nr:ABC transporter ATP-binding protein [Alkalicoccus halolimnae]TXF81976.1 ABC transporter ATP-binding protein [Alkalicoccus halolimnae]